MNSKNRRLILCKALAILERRKHGGKLSPEKAKETFLDVCRYEKGLSPLTIKAYSKDIELLFRELRCKYISEVTQDMLRGWLREASRKYNPRSLKRKSACYRCFFNIMVQCGHIEKSPCDGLHIEIRETKELPRNLCIAEYRSILDRAKANEREARTILKKGILPKKQCMVAYFVAIRDLLVIELLFATGARVHELCNLTENDWNPAEGSFRIFGKGRKERKVYIDMLDDVKRELAQYIAFRTKMGFSGSFILLNKWGKPLTTQAVRNIVTKYVKLCGIKKNVTPHYFRHAYASLLLESGMDIKYIQHFLGHSSIVTTQGYLHVSEEGAKKMLEKYHPRLKI